MKEKIKHQLRIPYSIMVLLGFDPRKTIHAIRNLPFYLYDLKILKNQQAFTKNSFPFGKFYPIFEERTMESGSAKGHYFHQDLLVARRISLNNPKIHVDVGSRVDGFTAHVASFRSIEVIDIRPLSSHIPNVHFMQADLTKNLEKDLIDYCDSLSCLHAIEHFGLGRYGDPVNYDGHLIGLKNLYRILKRYGKLYISVPIGPQRIEFNAHRVFSIVYLLELFVGKYQIDRFSFVDDRGDLHENVTLTDDGIENNFGCNYGCGIFEMTKL
ncbi:MAG: DUF268 domain-containing protein [bacterium]